MNRPRDAHEQWRHSFPVRRSQSLRAFPALICRIRWPRVRQATQLWRQFSCFVRPSTRRQQSPPNRVVQTPGIVDRGHLSSPCIGPLRLSPFLLHLWQWTYLSRALRARATGRHPSARFGRELRRLPDRLASRAVSVEGQPHQEIQILRRTFVIDGSGFTAWSARLIRHLLNGQLLRTQCTIRQFEFCLDKSAGYTSGWDNETSILQTRSRGNGHFVFCNSDVSRPSRRRRGAFPPAPPVRAKTRRDPRGLSILASGESSPTRDDAPCPPDSTSVPGAPAA
jgi:hypothetical protein